MNSSQVRGSRVLSEVGSSSDIASLDEIQRRWWNRHCCAIGGAGVFRSWLKLDYLLATGLAVEIAVIHNFLWHERFTWADRPATGPMHSLVRLAKFNASNGAVSMVGNLGLMRLLVGELKFNYVAANFIAIVVVFAGEFSCSAIASSS